MDQSQDASHATHPECTSGCRRSEHPEITGACRDGYLHTRECSNSDLAIRRLSADSLPTESLWHCSCKSYKAQPSWCIWRPSTPCTCNPNLPGSPTIWHNIPQLEKSPPFRIKVHYCRAMCTLINAYHKAEPPVGLFNYTIKAHYLMHLGVCARYTNPSFGSCYQGETLMQTCKSLFQASCRGSAALAACNTAMYRFVMARAVALCDHLEIIL